MHISMYKKETDAKVEAVIGVHPCGWVDEAITILQLGRQNPIRK